MLTLEFIIAKIFNFTQLVEAWALDINLGINRSSFRARELISRKVDRLLRLSRHRRERIGVLPRTLCKCSANTRGGTCPRGPAGKLRFTRLPTSPADTRSMFPSTCAPLHSGLPRPMKGSTESLLSPAFRSTSSYFYFFIFSPVSVMNRARFNSVRLPCGENHSKLIALIVD